MNALLEKALHHLSPDKLLQTVMGSLIKASNLRFNLGRPKELWSPGKPLKLLFAGYVGARNTGADVRVEEMLRQMRTILGEKHAELAIITTDLNRTAGYFQGVRQVPMPLVYPRFLFEQCPKYHGVVACEGSMFKSKFSNALSVMMTSALGLASSENKLSIGYGAEAGTMDEDLQDFVRHHCANSLILCRNEPSRKVLGKLGVRATGGTDTAWTFQPSPKKKGAAILKKHGWDGKQKVLVVCPINPFWWPIAPSYSKTASMLLLGEHKEEHYQSIYFHNFSEENRRAYHQYLNRIANAVNAFVSDENAFVVLVGMEKLDRRACSDLASKLNSIPPQLISDEYNMFDLVSILRNADWLVSSRYHAIVTSMPALIPSAGITMDERIRNVMTDRGHEHLSLNVDDADLEEKLLHILRELKAKSKQISHEIGKVLPRQLELMGEMGITFMEEVARVYPEFPQRKTQKIWSNFIPPISKELDKIVEKYS